MDKRKEQYVKVVKIRAVKDERGRWGLILRAMKTNDTISRLRMLGYFEAFSWVLLLFIAMPLKYFGGQPIMVKYVGWIHGILFILYSLHLVLAMRLQNWSFGKLATGGVAAFLPFGTLWFDKRIQ